MRHSRALPFAALALAVLAGCASRSTSGELRGEPVALPERVNSIRVPLDVQEFDVVAGDDGYRGVFVKLTGLPTGVTHSSQNDPARIVVTIAGDTGSESPPESFAAGDDVVTKIMLARRTGYLQVFVDLDADQTPEYEVLPMADWVLVRIKSTLPKKPWAHRAS